MSLDQNDGSLDVDIQPIDLSTIINGSIVKAKISTNNTWSKSDNPATTVYTDQANTFGAFLQKFQAGTNLSLTDTGDTTKILQLNLGSITAGTTRTLTVPDVSDTIVLLGATQTLAGKTLSSPVLSGTATGTYTLGGTPTLSSALTLSNKITTYNNVATTGLGVPAVYGYGRPANGQTGAVASVATYTVGGSDGSFIVSANGNITTFVAGTFNVTVTYTDETNTSQTLKLNFSTITGTIGIALAASGPFEGIPTHIRAKSGTTITMATSGTFTSLTYNVEGSIIQIA